jgi:hypothetical protein
MANTSSDPMALICQAITNYQPFTAFGRKALSTLLYAIDEIHDTTPVEQDIDYSKLIELLREDFPMDFFITTESITGDGPVLRIIKNALTLSGHNLIQAPGQPLIKVLISELYCTSEATLNDAKALYHQRIAELRGPISLPSGNATTTAGHQTRQVTHSQHRPSSPLRVSNRPASPASPSFGPATSAPSDNIQFNNYYGGPASPSFPHSSSRHVSFKNDSQTSQDVVNMSESQDARSLPPTEPKPVNNNPSYQPQVNSAIYRTGNITTRDNGRQHHLQLNSSDNSSIHVNHLINANQQDNETSSSSSYQMQPTSSAQLAMANQIRTAHQVSRRFSQANAKYAGKSKESLADKFQVYRTVARDYQFISTQKVAVVHNIFDEEALRYYNAHVRDQSTTLEKVYEGMYAEFNSVTRQDRCKNQLRALRLHTIFETKNLPRHLTASGTKSPS